MKKLCTILSVLLVLFSCEKKQDDVYLYLTQEQKDFINTAHTGDTVIWESNGGVKDTAIIQPVIYERYFNDAYTNPKINAEKASYEYKIIGTNKLRTPYDISVYTDIQNNSLANTAYCGHKATGLFKNKKMGVTNYTDVYWYAFATNSDTIFWNAQGYLGYDYAGVRVERIK